jgi:hypothetical protein
MVRNDEYWKNVDKRFRCATRWDAQTTCTRSRITPPRFDVLGDLLRTGPTGTNVMDLAIAVVG